MSEGMLLWDFARRAEQLFPANAAIRDDDTSYTYAELAERCRKLAGGLRALGVERGDRVATALLNGHRYLELYLTCAGLGAIIVPLNSRLAEPEIRYILDDAGVKLLVADQWHLDHVLGAAPDAVALNLRAPDEYDALLASAERVVLPDPAIRETDVCGYFYTGGTTGKAKGVMLSHRNAVVNAMQLVPGLGWNGEDVFLHCAPMFHLADAASIWGITGLGACHSFVPAFEPALVLRTFATDQVSVTILVPTMINMLLNHPDFASTDTSSLRLVMHGAAPIASGLLTRAVNELGCSFAQAYGMTEASPVLTLLTGEESLIGSDRLRAAGREVLGVEVTIRHEDGTLCEAGEVGEIVARGGNIMLGYLNKPAETDAVLRDGWYWTGDMGYLDAERYLFVVDRSKDMIVSGGENVYSVEVEDAIMQHPAVLECAVIGIPDEAWGEAVHAVVVLKPGQELSAADLREHCKTLIAGYKCPRGAEFLPELPKSGAGKILKRDLRDAHWAGRERQVA